VATEPGSMPLAEKPADPLDRLDSWKEIAAYLRRDVTTVQRWEKRERLPVHRHQHDRQGTVYAYRSELDRWRAQRQQPGSAGAGDRGEGAERGGRRPAWLGLAIAAALLLTAGAAVVTVTRQVARGSVDTPLARFSIFPPPLQTFNHLALSADGRQLVYSAGPTLHVRRLDELNARPVPRTEGAYDPFWSPDGEWVAYFSGNELKKVRVSSPAPRTVAPARRSMGGAWGARGDLLFAADRGTLLYRVDEAGGKPTPIRRAGERPGWQAIRWPHFLPDGQRFLYFVRSDNPDVQGVYLGSLARADGSADIRVAEAASNVFYSAGHLAFVRRGTLFAQPFDVSRARATGDAFPIVERIDQDPYDDGFALFSVAINGVLAYRGGVTEDRELRWFDRAGRQLGALVSPGEYRDLAISRDGRRLAYEQMDPHLGTRDVWIRELDRGGLLRLTAQPDEDGAPVWSPDGRELAFSGIRDRQIQVLKKSAAGGRETTLLKAAAVPLDWSPDGRRLVVELMTPGRGTDLMLLDVEDGSLAPYLATPYMEREAQFSPDGRFMAYSSSESGQREVYVEPIPRDGRRWRLSTDFGREPRWRGDGQEIFYLGRQDTLMSVAVTPAGANLNAAGPAPLFRTRIRSADVRYHYAASPDGERFLVNTVVEDAPGTPINVWIDWLAGTRGTR